MKKKNRKRYGVYILINRSQLSTTKKVLMLQLPGVKLYTIELQASSTNLLSESEVKESIAANLDIPLEHIHVQWFTEYPLLTLQVYPTLRCPNSCKFCYLGSAKENATYSYLKLPIIEFLTSQIQRLPVPFVEVLGGEPLLPGVWNSLKDFILKSVESDKLVHISTAYGLNEYNRRYFHDFMKRLKYIAGLSKVSYISPEMSVSIHGDTRTEKLLGIDTPLYWRENLIFYLSEKANRDLIRVGISTVLTPHLEKHLKEYISTIGPLLEYVDFINLMFPMGRVPKINGISLDLITAWKIARSISSEINKLTNDVRINFNFPFQYAFKYREGILKTKIENIKNDLEAASIFIGCSGAKTRMEILPNGDVVPCGLFIEDKQFYYPLNILKEKDVFRVWESGRHIRKKLYITSISHTQNTSCSRCSLLNICEQCPYIITEESVKCPLGGS